MTKFTNIFNARVTPEMQEGLDCLRKYIALPGSNPKLILRMTWLWTRTCLLLINKQRHEEKRQRLIEATEQLAADLRKTHPMSVFVPFIDDEILAADSVNSLRLVGDHFTYTFSSRNDAGVILGHMRKIVETFGVATVSDFYELLGMAPDKQDNEWGWTNESDFDVSISLTINGQYTIKLPPPHSL